MYICLHQKCIYIVSFNCILLRIPVDFTLVPPGTTENAPIEIEKEVDEQQNKEAAPSTTQSPTDETTSSEEQQESVRLLHFNYKLFSAWLLLDSYKITKIGYNYDPPIFANTVVGIASYKYSQTGNILTR